MNKSNYKTTLLAGLLLPLSAFASPDEEVTIRVMGIDETSSDAVIKLIELPLPDPQSIQPQTRAAQDEQPSLQQQNRESDQGLHHERQMEQLQEFQKQQQEFELDRELNTGPASSPQNGGGPGG